MTASGDLELGGTLRALRLARGLGLDGAAFRGGISKGALSAWENGKVRPRGALLGRLLDALEADSRTRARLLVAADPIHAHMALAVTPRGAPVPAGAVVRAMRTRRGLTQADLARQVGVAQSTVARWETGEFAPSAETLHAVAFALGASAEEAVALSCAGGEGGADLPDDPEATLLHFRHKGPPAALKDVVLLGWEADLWRRAARDARWDACLISVLTQQATGFLTLERYDAIAAPARRAVAMAKTTEEREQAVGSVAALADYDRHRGAGHAAAAEMADAWAALLPDSLYRSWMLHQRGMCLARMGAGDEGASLIARATEMNVRLIPSSFGDDPWSFHTISQCDARLAAGEPAKAAALVGGRRERDFAASNYVRVEHANGRAATDADMAHLRYQGRERSDNPHARRALERIERRQAKLTGGEPVPFSPTPTDPATEDRLWAAVLRENRG